MTCQAAAAALIWTGTSADPAGLLPVVDAFRAQISAGGSNNGVGGSFTTGRREVAWDAASLDPVQIPAAMPGDFFNTFSQRGLVLSTPGSLRVSGRAASGSTDVLFSSLNPRAASALQALTPERMLAVYGATTVNATFFLPGSPSQPAFVRGFGLVVADVNIAGSTRLEALDALGTVIGSVDVPPAPNGLSFAGLWMEGSTWISSVRLTAGQTGINDTTSSRDIVAMDDFIFAEPQLTAIPEPTAPLLLALAVISLLGGRRRLP